MLMKSLSTEYYMKKFQKYLQGIIIFYLHLLTIELDKKSFFNYNIYRTNF